MHKYFVLFILDAYKVLNIFYKLLLLYLKSDKLKLNIYLSFFSVFSIYCTMYIHARKLYVYEFMI